MELLGILLKINVSLLIFYLVYRLALRKLTFYNFNRIYQLASIVISAMIPFVQYSKTAKTRIETLQLTTGISPSIFQNYVTDDAQINFVQIASTLYWAGVWVMAGIFMLQLFSLIALFFRSKKTDVLGYNIRTTSTTLNPFSFFKSIFVNPQEHSMEALQSILQHENVHAQQWHSLDVIVGEIKRIFCWFNPAAWLMLAAIRENLEFIADRKVLQSGVDRKDYQYSLLSVQQGAANNSLTNNFNFSHLKLRITMMNKTKSSDMHLLKYLLAVPVVACALLLTNFAQAQEREAELQKMHETTSSDTTRHSATNLENGTQENSPYSRYLKDLNSANIFTSTMKYVDGEPTKYDYTNIKSFKIITSSADGLDLKFTDDNSSLIIEKNENDAIAAAAGGLHKNDVVVYVNDELYTKPLNTIDPKNIVQMSISSGHSTKDFHKAIPEGKTAIDIITKDYNSEKTATKPDAATNEQPYIFVNGERYLKDLSSLNPKLIEEIIVLKDQTVASKYPQLPEGASVIEITTKESVVTKTTHHINIFPNPTSNSWKIDFPDAGANDSYELFDQQGRKRASGKLHKTNEIDASKLENGVYFMKTKLATGNSETRLQVQR